VKLLSFLSAIVTCVKLGPTFELDARAIVTVKCCKRSPEGVPPVLSIVAAVAVAYFCIVRIARLRNAPHVLRVSVRRKKCFQCSFEAVGSSALDHGGEQAVSCRPSD